MDYKNFIIRTSIAFLFLFIYFAILTLDNIFILYLFILVYLCLIIEVLLFFTNLKKIFLTYLIISLFCFIFYYKSYFNILEFNLFVLTIIIFDTSSYIFGSVFGKKIIIKKISPNKTYSGLILGIISANFFSFLYIEFYYKNLIFEKIIFINLVILFSFFGDILESYIKRKNDLKNSSNFIPGHGGFLDRFDSFIFAIILLFIYKTITFLWKSMFLEVQEQLGKKP